MQHQDPQVEYVIALIEKTMKSTPELSKRGINWDHKDISEMLAYASLHRVLIEIRDELRLSNVKTRIEANPLSMLNR